MPTVALEIEMTYFCEGVQISPVLLVSKISHIARPSVTVTFLQGLLLKYWSLDFKQY